MQTRLHCPEIPPLSSYQTSPPESFWSKFPFNPMPKEPATKLDIRALKDLVTEKKEFLTSCQILRAEKCIDYLVNGADAFQKFPLPSCFLKNADSTFEFGKEVTDTIAVWVKKGFAAGPFVTPPLKNFRSNSLMAIKQGEKVRPVLNLSLPKECCFNSAVDEEKLEKVYMSSAKKFSRSVVEAGQYAKMFKFDLVDAYKNVPAKVSDFRIQGFSWLNRYFFETKQIFGAKTAVCNFDILGNTILALALCDAEIPRCFVHRTLDDVPILSPCQRQWGSRLAENYVSICKKVNIDVTTSCPKFEKAFTDSTFGKVLGIFFDTETMTWSLPFRKVQKTLIAVKNVLLQDFLDLESFQQLMGRLNYVTQFSNFLRGMKFNLNKTLGNLQRGMSLKLSYEAKCELFVFANFLLDNEQWHSLDPIHYSPPLGYYEFVSDAAGSSGESKTKRVGCGSIGFDEDGVYVFAKQLFWPEKFLEKTDEEGCQYGQKTTTLEFVGILLPFLIMPKSLANRYIVVKVDNIGCYFGWVNRQAAGDGTASLLIRVLHLISQYLRCDIHIEHLPRLSTWEAQLVDRISRESSTTKADRDLLNSFSQPDIPDCFAEWLKDPVSDWDLCVFLLKHIMELCNK
jgi:hypothetical protein